ncbi:MAG TPA: protein kinase [Vicinamibacteria bacterium]|nr:protein kinase [Vicinamibacteria bacterium]
MIGRTVSHYRVLEEIGRGGMGVVYRALDTTLGREVALKVLGLAAGRDAEQERRLKVEARAAAALAHPAVSVVYEIDEVEGAIFIAMELVRGRPLAALLAGAPMPPARALDLAIEVAEGLAEAHARGVVHRDLKPKNVMLTESGHAKIIDFGLAKLVRPRPPFESGADTPAWGDTDPGRILGTAAYMSPEQVRGAEVDARSDLFAFGALLYEMLSGEPAFRRETGVETLHAVLKEPAPRLRAEGLGAAAHVLRHVLDRCLAKAPADRYASAADLLSDLREARRRLEAADSGDRPAPAAPAGVRPAPGPPARLRVVIVDDEEPARALLREYVGRAEGVEVVAECRNGFEAVKAVNDLAPDLVFLDVQMPKLNGFEVLELLGREVAVVFATAFDEHAIRAFEVNAVDYILKPVSPERVATAIDRARQRIAARSPLLAAQLAAAARPAGEPASRIVVRQGPKVHVIPADKLDYAEAQDDYVSLRSEGKSYLKQQTLGDLEASVDPRRFVRIHRSCLLNIDRLARIDTEGGEPRAVVLHDGTRLPLSRSGYGRLKTLL